MFGDGRVGGAPAGALAPMGTVPLWHSGACAGGGDHPLAQRFLLQRSIAPRGLSLPALRKPVPTGA